jgi:inner membrane protein
MDTGSHLLFGTTLAGLAFIDPVVANHPSLFYAVLAGTLIGSHAPDFDTLTRLKSYSAYIRLHRGITHSIPAMFIWPIVIAAPLAFTFGEMHHLLHLYLWTMLAVIFHVFLDLFNAYGVQCLRPFSSKWKHLDTLALFDPFLGILHVTGVGMWLLTNMPVASLFSTIYLLTFLYISVRYWHHRQVISRIRQELRLKGICKLVPSLNWFKWQFILDAENSYYTGSVDYRKVRLEAVYEKNQSHFVIEASKGTDGVRAFLKFAQNIHVSFREREDGYEVQWRDVRFWHKQNMPFGADVSLDRNLKVTSDRVGWNKKYWDPPYV